MTSFNGVNPIGGLSWNWSYTELELYYLNGENLESTSLYVATFSNLIDVIVSVVSHHGVNEVSDRLT